MVQAVCTYASGLQATSLQRCVTVCTVVCNVIVLLQSSG